MSRNILGAVLVSVLTAGVALATPAAQAVSTAPEATAQTESTYTSVSPVRVLDTRTGAGTPVGAGGTVTIDLASHVPAGTTAVVLNVTGVAPTAATHVIVYPGGAPRPTASSLNLAAGDTRPNQVTVSLGANRTVSLYNNAGAVHLVADLAGHYGIGTGAGYTALGANRLLDTRGDNTPFGPGTTRVLDLGDRVPESATAVTFNLTATGPSDPTFVTAWPAGVARPNASNLNLPAGDTRANLVTVAVGADRKVSLYNNAGSVHLIADLTGFYTPASGAVFVPRDPVRVLDTRTGSGPVGTGSSRVLDLAGTVPLTTTGVVLNVTAVDATASTYVTVWTNTASNPGSSTLNLSAGQTVPNAAVVKLGDSREVNLYNNNGSVHLVVDLAGVFVPPGTPCSTDCVYAWGYNGPNRQLGTAETVYRSSTPTQVATLARVSAVAGTAGNTYALRSGMVFAWGDNAYGQLGGGWTSAGSYGGGSALPLPVLGLTDVTAIASGSSTAYALRADGTVWAWGMNGGGQLGNGGYDGSSVPVQVTGLTDAVAIAASDLSAYALRADGTVWAWGSNGGGHLGSGLPCPEVCASPVPVQVSGMTGVTAIAGHGQGGYALRADGTVWAWGGNSYGQLGNGQSCPTSVCWSGVPVQVSGLSGVASIAGGWLNGYAVRDDGTVWGWGRSGRGILGNGVDCDSYSTTCLSAVPVQASNLSDVTQVASFDEGAYALRADGTVWAWGDDFYYALGNDSATLYSTVPVPVTGLTGVSAITGSWNAGYAIVPNP
jgi:alpha-tubulin suppressor-like RCC1 family protein